MCVALSEGTERMFVLSKTFLCATYSFKTCTLDLFRRWYVSSSMSDTSYKCDDSKSRDSLGFHNAIVDLYVH